MALKERLKLGPSFSRKRTDAMMKMGVVNAGTGRLFFNTVDEMDEYPYTNCDKSRPNYLRQEWMT